MPKHFSPSEKAEIKKLLMDTALVLFERFGVNKTTISDITSAAGVGKGTFYLFFSSKGELYIELLNKEWIESHGKLESKYMNRKGSFEEVIVPYIKENREWFRNHPFISMIYQRDTLAIISEPHSLKELQKFTEMADQRLTFLIDNWYQTNNIKSDISPNVLSGMLRSINYLSYHEDEIGQDVFEKSIYYIIKGVSCLYA